MLSTFGEFGFSENISDGFVSKENFIGASLGNQKQIDTFVSTPILRDINSKVDNIPGRTEDDGEGVHGGVGGAALLGLGLLRGPEVHQL